VNSQLFNKLCKIAKSLRNDSRYKHFSFILHKKRIVSVGWNNTNKSHPIAKKYGHRFNSRHSEVHAVSKFPYRIKKLRDCVIVNIRLTKKGKIAISKPCRFCQQFLAEIRIKEVWFTNDNERLELWR
jgi:tRNA(Arg) A34 adenosine deaminase TadA